MSPRASLGTSLALRRFFTSSRVIASGALLCACAGPPRPLRLAEPALLSAFFGLDDQMPARAGLLCRGAEGQDGMPVIFSRRVVGRVAPAAFAVHTRSGAVKRPRCATTAPAGDASEGHTVLLIGDLGDDAQDPPLQVRVDGALGLEGGASATGLAVTVTPLAAGPTLVLAQAHRSGGIRSQCPRRARALVQVVWAGGVTAASDEAHRQAYQVELAEGGAVVPFALGDLGDQDNYVHLCLDTDRPLRAVCAAPGVLADPRGDRNPRTCVSVRRDYLPDAPALPATSPPT